MFERFRLIGEKRPYGDVNVIATSHGPVVAYHLVEGGIHVATEAYCYSTERSFSGFLRFLFLGERKTESIPEDPTMRQDISTILKKRGYVEPITFP